MLLQILQVIAQTLHEFTLPFAGRCFQLFTQLVNPPGHLFAGAGLLLRLLGCFSSVGLLLHLSDRRFQLFGPFRIPLFTQLLCPACHHLHVILHTIGCPLRLLAKGPGNPKKECARHGTHRKRVLGKHDRDSRKLIKKGVYHFYC